MLRERDTERQAAPPARDRDAAATREATGAPPAPATAPAPAKAALQIIAAVAAPATVLTALMYYFGWMYTRTFTTLGIGVDPQVLGYSTHDYLLRSVDALFGPLAMLCVLLLAIIWLHGRITAHTATPAWAEGLARVAVVVAALGLVVAVSAAIAVFRPAGVEVAGFRIAYPDWAPRWGLALGIVLGVGLADYAVHLRRRLGGTGPDPGAGWAGTTQRAALGGLMLLGLFWGVTVWAQDVGEVRAAALRHDPAQWRELPTVALYSPHDLLLDAPGVVAGRCQGDEAAYRFRYTGLRLFAYSNEKYVFLPDAWPETGGPAIVLSDAPELRVELLPGSAAPAASAACPPG